MKRLLAYGFVAAVVLSGCQKEQCTVNNQESVTFYATIEDAGAKTSLDGLNVLWKQGDQVSIYNGSTINEKWQVSDDSDGKTSATLNSVDPPSFVAGGEIDNNVAFYPYASTNNITKSGSNYVIDINLAATQNYAADSFGNGTFPMAAVTASASDYKLKFKNVLGALNLQLKGTATITSISVCGNNNEILCGPAKVTVSVDNTPSINLTEVSAKTVTLDCGAGVQLNSTTATSFIIALPPMEMTGGFSVIITDNGGNQKEISTVKSRTFKRSTMLSMPELTYEALNDKGSN